MNARRSVWAALVSVCVIAGLFTYGAASALALSTHELVGEFNAGSDPDGIAIDESSGEVYVAESATGVVDRFDAAGSPASFPALGGHMLDGAGTPAGSFVFPHGETSYGAPAGLAVDNDALSSSYRDLYVVDAGHGVVDKFDATGAYVGQLTGTPGGPFAGPYGVAVDPAGDVWVYESSGEVDEFNAAGVYRSQFATGCGTTYPGVAVDSSDDVYVNCGFAIQKWSSTGADLGAVTEGSTHALAVDQANGHVFADEEEGRSVREYEASGTEVARFEGMPYASQSNYGGIAVDGVSGDVYLSTSNGGTVFRWGPLVTLPDVSTEPASVVQSTAASVHGTVNPDGIPVTVCRFEYGTSEAYGQSAPCVPGPGSGFELCPGQRRSSWTAAGQHISLPVGRGKRQRSSEPWW